MLLWVERCTTPYLCNSLRYHVLIGLLVGGATLYVRFSPMPVLCLSHGIPMAFPLYSQSVQAHSGLVTVPWQCRGSPEFPGHIHDSRIGGHNKVP